MDRRRQGGIRHYLLGSTPKYDGCRARFWAAGEEVPALGPELCLLELLAVPQDVGGDAVDGRLHLSPGGLWKERQIM